MKVGPDFPEEDFELDGSFFAPPCMAKLRKGAGEGGEAADKVVHVLGRVVPVDVLELAGEFGGGLEELGALDEAALHAQFHVLLDDAFHRFHHQRGAQLHQLVVKVSGRVRGFHPALGTQDDAARVYLLVYHEGGYAGDVLPVNHRPVDGRGPAVLRQQGGVQVEGAQLGHFPYRLGQHAESHHHKQIGLQGGQLAEELRVLELFRLHQGQAFRHRVFLDGALAQLEPAAGGLVRGGYNAHHIETGFPQGLERSHGEFRRSHIYNPSLSEHTNNFTLEFPVPALHQIYVQQAGVLDGLHRQEASQRAQDKGRYEFSHKGAGLSVVGQPLSDDVNHPVQHEEQHGEDGGCTQATLLEQGPDGGADEKEQHAGKGLGELLPDFHVRAVNQAGIVGRIHNLALGDALVLPGIGGGIVVGSFFVADALPGAVRVRLHHGGGYAAPGAVQLFAPVQDVLPQEVFHMPLRSLVHQGLEGVVPVPEGFQVHGTHLFSVAGAVRLVVGVILQRNHQFLCLEGHPLQGQGGVSVLAGVFLLVVYAVI